MTHDTELDRYLAHFQWRVLQDALTQATAGHWDHRAHQLEWARPHRGDYPGTAAANATGRDRALASAARTAKYRELTDLAALCRRKAALLRDTGLDVDTQALIAEILIEHAQQVA